MTADLDQYIIQYKTRGDKSWIFLIQSPVLNDVFGTRHVGRRWDGGDDWRMNIQHTFLDSSLLEQIFYSATALAFISLLGYNFGFFHSGRVLYLSGISDPDTLFPLTNYLIMIFLGDSFPWRSFPSFGVFQFHLTKLEHLLIYRTFFLVLVPPCYYGGSLFVHFQICYAILSSVGGCHR